MSSWWAEWHACVLVWPAGKGLLGTPTSHLARQPATHCLLLVWRPPSCLGCRLPVDCCCCCWLLQRLVWPPWAAAARACLPPPPPVEACRCSLCRSYWPATVCACGYGLQAAAAEMGAASVARVWCQAGGASERRNAGVCRGVWGCADRRQLLAVEPGPCRGAARGLTAASVTDPLCAPAACDRLDAEGCRCASQPCQLLVMVLTLRRWSQESFILSAARSDPLLHEQLS